MSELQIHAKWTWTPDAVVCEPERIVGGNMPSEIRAHLQRMSIKLPKGDKCWSLLDKLANYLTNTEPHIEPLNLGFEKPIEAIIKGISLMRKEIDSITIYYFVQYGTLEPKRVNVYWKIIELPKIIIGIIKEAETEIYKNVQFNLLSQIGDGKIDRDKWTAEKTTVFISYRSTHEDYARALNDLLGAYENGRFFLPWFDKLDLQAGDWKKQLFNSIEQSEIFVPILSRNYLTGPVASQELEKAMREILENNKKRIIPVLIEGSPNDYNDHYLGSMQMVIANDGINNEIIDKLAHYALGSRKNK